LQAAFVILLSRYTGQHDILIGSPIAGRNRSDTEPLIGFFANMILLRTDVSGDPTLRELLARVRRNTLNAYMHQDFPFDRLVEELGPERNLSYNSVFQVLFALQNAPVHPLELSGLQVERLRIERGTVRFDLEVHLSEVEGDITGSFIYDTDLFSRDTISRMIDHFRRLLANIVAEPNRHISELRFLSGAEEHQLLVTWNETSHPYPHNAPVHELFEAQAQRTPRAVAAVFQDQRLSYEELNTRTDKLARYLCDLGAGPEVSVGICIERSLDLLIGVLAILKSGAAYVPLDPAYPKSRLEFMVTDSGLQLILTQTALVNELPETPARIIDINAWHGLASQEVVQPLPHKADLENPAYIIYTSGSTGQPKGVVLPHRALANLILWHLSALGASDRTLQFASLSFDASFHEIFCALCSGGAVVLIDEVLRKDLTSLADSVNEASIDKVNLPVVVLQRWAEDSKAQANPFPSLRTVITTGEKLLVTRAIVDLFKRMPHCSLHNQYGPSETHVVTAYTFGGQPDDWPADPPIGRPISNTQIYILDRYLAPVPVGVAGELYIGGINLARGYLNRPDLTAEKFVPHPFSRQHGARLYRSGDLARYLPDGNIEFLGRIDNQVKIRGFRVELGEIEATLAQHPQVKEAVVLAREDTPGPKQLVAYVILDKNRPPTASELHEFLKQRLPDHMIPSAFVSLDAFPLTPNGKVDHRVLPSPNILRLGVGTEYVAPSTPVEEIIVGVWIQLLQVTQVGLHDDFFELGGHSLLATQLMSRMRTIFAIELPLRLLFEEPTVAALARAIEAARSAQPRLEAQAIHPSSREGGVPLSFAQQRLWFLHQITHSPAIYNVPSAVRIKGNLDVPAMERSLSEIVRRHEALRTVFHPRDGLPPLQVILPPQPVQLHVLDLPTASPDLDEQAQNEQAQEVQRAHQVQSLLSQEAGQPFDLALGPPVRFNLLRVHDEEYVFQVTMHHIVTDGWSMGIFFTELSALYQAFSHAHSNGANSGGTEEVTSSPLPELRIQYADYAQWQREWLSGEVLAKQLDYWRGQLAGAPPLLQLPTTHPRPPSQSFNGATHRFTLGVQLSRQLEELSREAGATLFMTLQAAFVILLSRYTGQHDILIGSPIAGRNRSDTEPLIGLFVDMLVLRTRLDGNPTFLELLAQVRDTSLAGYEHQDLPFELLIEACEPPPNQRAAPLVQISFTLHNTPTASLQINGLTATRMEIEGQAPTLDLEVHLRQIPEGIRGSFIYNRDLFDSSTMIQLSNDYQALLEQIAREPQLHIDDYSVAKGGARTPASATQSPGRLVKGE
ncbi:MAG: amino acid adenylation domain-containing protein, partial [Chloroflexia bacterium]